jgi:hypothetical protein
MGSILQYTKAINSEATESETIGPGLTPDTIITQSYMSGPPKGGLFISGLITAPKDPTGRPYKIDPNKICVT